MKTQTVNENALNYDLRRKTSVYNQVVATVQTLQADQATAQVKQEQADKANCIDLFAQSKDMFYPKHGIQRHELGLSPVTFPSSVSNQIRFSTTSIISKNISLLENTQLYPNVANTYNVHAFYQVIIYAPNTTLMTSIDLQLFKNGAFYSTLDSKLMFVPIPLYATYYFPVATLNGTDDIELKVGDYIEIRMVYTLLGGGRPLTAAAPDQHRGYLNIKYYNNIAET